MHGIRGREETSPSARRRPASVENRKRGTTVLCRGRGVVVLKSRAGHRRLVTPTPDRPSHPVARVRLIFQHYLND